MTGVRLFLIAAVALALAGCLGGDDFSDLQAYMDEVRARPQGAIEPLPKFQPYEAFTYSAAAVSYTHLTLPTSDLV